MKGGGLSSDLIRAATALTFAWWFEHYGVTPSEPLRTEIDGSRVKRKRDPGRCFLRAGWRRIETTTRSHRHRSLVILEAPMNERQA